MCTWLPDAFCENTGHFVNSVASTVICVVSVTGKKTTSIVKPQWFAHILAGSLHFGVCVWRDNRTKDCVNSSNYTSLKWMSWPDSLVDSSKFEKFCVCSFSKLQIHFQNTGFLPDSANCAVKYRPSGNPKWVSIIIKNFKKCRELMVFDFFSVDGNWFFLLHENPPKYIPSSSRVLVEIDAGQQVHLQCFFTEARPYQRDVSKLPGGVRALTCSKTWEV